MDIKNIKATTKNSMGAILNILLLFTVCAILFISIFDYSSPNVTSFIEEVEPYSVVELADGSKEYLFNVFDYDNNYSGIMFYTAHQLVTAYNAGREIYSFSEVNQTLGSTPGSTYNFVKIQGKTPVITVKVTPVYKEVVNQKLTFYIGNSYEMYKDLMVKSMPRFIVSMLIVIFSIVMLLLYLFMHKRLLVDRDLLYLGYFAFFAGVWCINETDVSTLLITDKAVDALVPYICLMLCTQPFVLFFDSYLDINSKVFKQIFMAVASLQTVILSIFHFTHIFEFRQTLFVTQIMLVISAIYVMCCVISKIIQKNFTIRVRVCAIGLSLFLVSTFVDISNYYRYLGDADILGRYAFFIFIIMLAWDLIKEAYDIVEKSRHVKQLELFALTDTMTGLFNRNAFESHAKTENKLEGLVAVVADANGLKCCNDTYGHEAGDLYITTVAEIFNEVYGKYGNCYRTGGDEFCCIIQEGKHVNLERLKKIFITKIYTANLENQYKFSMAVAIGDAIYDSSIDTDFRALVKRADAHMYENKRAYKSC